MDGDDIDSKYIVTDLSVTKTFPSRESIYDSQFKELSIDKKRLRVFQILEYIGFKKSINESIEDLIAQEGLPSDFGKYSHQLIRTQEKIFTRQVLIKNKLETVNLRLKPNLNIIVDYIGDDDMSYVPGLINHGGKRLKTIYSGFCSFKDLFVSLNSILEENIEFSQVLREVIFNN